MLFESQYLGFPVFVVAFLSVCLFWLSGHYLLQVTQAVVYATILLSIVMITGLSGQISLCQMSFAGVGAFTATLTEYTRAREPLDWATTQMDLGAALGRLGERESGTASLDKAVAALTARFNSATASLSWATVA